MANKRYSQAEINKVLKEAAAGTAVAEIIRRHGIAEATFYRWRARQAAPGRAEGSRLERLDEENRRLKHLLAETTLEIHTLREELGNKKS
ncbi:transposase [Oceanibacterium hippocampi]|uniref:Transposase n=1 Tax=Oceanibacterium hippocampi TaxID=745714 RepID=A0A1Y5TDE3_9PROT|nr:transposase [Oceanibacterium hippocampi]SLN57828.1 Transposase [Oceanibacterium hippocampi]